MRTRRLIERIDGHMSRIDGHMSRIDEHMARGNELAARSHELFDQNIAALQRVNEELALSRESRDRMYENFRQLAHEMNLRFERVVRGFEAQVAKSNDSLDSLLHAVDAQSKALMLRLPPAPGGEA